MSDLRRVLVGADGRLVVTAAEPQPLGPTEVRLHVAYAGICGSDLHELRGAGDYGDGPRVGRSFGHEYSGVVTEVGSAVTTVVVGGRVTCAPRWPCLVCPMCRRGDTTHCQDLRRPSLGAWADEMVVPERAVFGVPDPVPLRTAALCEPLACALRGVDLVTVPSGHTALVVGGGPIGLLAAALARRQGARRVIVSEPRAIRRGLAERLGAEPIDPTTGDLSELLAEATDGLGPEVVYESVGNAQTVEQAVEVAAPGGTVIVLGVAPPAVAAAIRPWRLFERELTVRGAWGLETTFQRAVHWLGELDLDPLVTDVLGLERAEEAVDLAHSGDCGKVMFAPGAELG